MLSAWAVVQHSRRVAASRFTYSRRLAPSVGLHLTLLFCVCQRYDDVVDQRVSRSSLLVAGGRKRARWPSREERRVSCHAWPRRQPRDPIESWRPFRRDWSSALFLPGRLGSAEPRAHQNTALIGGVWWFGNKQGAW
jgi:hypothetical protein